MGFEQNTAILILMSDTKLNLEVWRGSGGYEDEQDGEAVVVLESSGDFELSVGSRETAFDEGAFRHTETFKQAVAYTVEHQQELYTSIMSGIRIEYNKAVADKDSYGDIADLYVPAAATDDELKKLITPTSIHINASEKDGFPYIGYEFECSWDEEHGVGVLMHKLEVDMTGQADTAFSDEHYWDTRKA